MADVINNSVISNSDYYIQLIHAAEQAQKIGNIDAEESIIEEMDQLWNEMSLDERKLVDEKLGFNIGI